MTANVGCCQQPVVVVVHALAVAGSVEGGEVGIYFGQQIKTNAHLIQSYGQPTRWQNNFYSSSSMSPLARAVPPTDTENSYSWSQPM